MSSNEGNCCQKVLTIVVNDTAMLVEEVVQLLTLVLQRKSVAVLDNCTSDVAMFAFALPATIGAIRRRRRALNVIPDSTKLLASIRKPHARRN